MASIGSLSVDLLLESSQFMSSMKKSADQSARTGEAIKENMDKAKEAVKGLAEAFAVDWLKEKIEQSLEYAESIAKVSEATGVSTKFVQEWQYATSQFGTSVETSQKELEKFNKNLGMASQEGGLQYQRILKNLGVTSNDSTIAIGQFADGISKMNNKAKEAADVTQFFGRDANDLIPLLEQGSRGFSELAQSADDLGIVLSDNVIENSAEAEHKLSALKEVLTAEWAQVIGDNADSIVSLADGLISLVSALGKFWAKNPQLALSIIGGLAGGFAGGLPGAAAGVVGGYELGGKVAQSQSDNNMDVNYRAQQFYKAHDEYQARLAVQSGQSAGNSHLFGLIHTRDGNNVPGVSAADAYKEEKRQYGLYKGAVYKAAHPEAEGGDGGDHSIKDLSPHKKPKADRSAEKAAQAAKRANELWDRTNDSSTQSVFQSREALTQDPTKLFDLKSQEDQADYNDKIAEILAATYSTDSTTNTIRKSILMQAATEEAANRKAALINQEKDQIATEQLALTNDDLENTKDHLQSLSDLATTSAERRKIGQQILDAEYQIKANTLKEQLASEQRDGASATVIAKTQQDINALPQQKADANASLNNQTMSPLEAYLKAIPSTAGEMSEALEKVDTDGLDSLNSGLLAAIQGTETLGAAFKGFTSSVLAGLAQIAIQETIIKPIGDFLFGGGSGGGSGLLGSLFKTIGGAVLGGATSGGTFSIAGVGSNIPYLTGHANGGLAQAGSYLVGERGPEIVNVGQSANVMTNHDLSQLSGGSERGVNITFGPITSNDPQAVKAMATQAIFEAMPLIVTQATNNTYTKLRRPAL